MRITIASILALAAIPAIAEIEPSTGAEIEAAIAGNTVDTEIDGAGHVGCRSSHKPLKPLNSFRVGL